MVLGWIDYKDSELGAHARLPSSRPPEAYNRSEVDRIWGVQGNVIALLKVIFYLLQDGRELLKF